MIHFIDSEFGEVKIYSNIKTKNIKFSFTNTGQIKMTVPYKTPKFVLKLLLRSSKNNIKKLIQQNQINMTRIYNGMQIGKKHSIIIRYSEVFSVQKINNTIFIKIPDKDEVNSHIYRNQISKMLIKCLKNEAKEYLPARLNALSEKFELPYCKLKFSHATSRWGSCSSAKTITLNIALMKLDYPLIDYVLIHELTHTVHLNHSAKFWKMLENNDPNFLLHKKLLKKYTPII